MLTSSSATPDLIGALSAAPPRLTLTGEDHLDRRGYDRSPVTYPSYRAGQPSPFKGEMFEVEVLEPEEVFALIAECAPTAAGRRDAAMITLMWRCGLRSIECRRLKDKDIDRRRGVLTILVSKKRPRRVVPIDAGALAMLDVWERERAQLPIPADRARLSYFCVVEGPTVGLEVGKSYLRNQLPKLADRAGIEKRVHCHGLRHTYASWALDNGVALHHLQVLLGHDDVRTTMRYALHINPVAVLEAMRGVSWPAIVAN